ncbi:butyrophilin-like protein 2 isoform X1 [Emydura macquarii macquarii]|uniref:butyrophilin-like protein 2 isoform X1 n=1 Tax=Emydura macquarii macquarii TaxID=1129001 RepID=UPI00352AD3D4
MIVGIRSIASLSIFPIVYIIKNWLSDEFTVTVHADPPIALVGQDVILSCQLTGQIPANVQVHLYKWERSKNMTLYSYNSTENGTELGRAGDQHRKDIPKGRYENGVSTVKLSPVGVEDNGQYVCAVTGDGAYQEAMTKVIVTGFGSAPRLTIAHQQNNSSILRCTSQGWYPQPEVRWTDSTGQNITAMAETIIEKNVKEMYQIHSTLKVADIASDTISCTIINPLLKRHQEKVIAISGFFHLEAEHDTITAVTGENVILPCRLVTKHLPRSMELQWRKVGPGKDKTIYFYLYDESSLRLNFYLHGDKCPASYLSPNGDNSREWLRKEYEKKVEVLKGKEFGKGNVSLKLNNVQVEDEGKYVCSAATNGFHREIIIEVLVIGAEDETSLQVDQEKIICSYECQWTGRYPKPIIFWRNHKGESITSLAETTEVQDEQNLFTVASTIAMLCDTPNVTCDIINPESIMSQQSTAPYFGWFLIYLLLFMAVISICKRAPEMGLEQFQRDYAQLRTEMDQQRREMNQLQRQRGAPEMGLEQLQRENAQLQTAMEQLQRENEEFREEKEQCQRENAQLRMEMNQVRRDRDQIQLERDELRMGREKKEEHSEEEEKETLFEAEMKKYRSKLEDLQRQNDQLKENKRKFSPTAAV